MRKKTDTAAGIYAVLAAYISWGLLPVYWKLLKSVPAIQTLSHRIIWSFFLVWILMAAQGRLSEFRETFSVSRNRGICLLTALIIGSNWLTYIWAINNNHIVDASLGYFINPLVSVLLGIVFLKEKLDRLKIIAVFLAGIGVVVLTVRFGRIPWVALLLATTFGFYGLIRKTAKIESLTGLMAETGILTPFLIGFLVFAQTKGDGVIGRASVPIHLLLVCAGLVTALPLLWFTIGVRKIPLSTAGFLQYVAPSLQLFMGVVVYGEEFSRIHLLSFGLIWIALITYSIPGGGMKPADT